MKFPPGTWRTNVRVGRLRPEAEAHAVTKAERRAMLPMLGSVDAIVFLHDKVIIVEAMIREQPGRIEQLVRYERLFKETEEFKEYWDFQIEKKIVTPLFIPFIEDMAKEFDISVEHYRPAWIMGYIRSLPRRLQRGSLSEVRPVGSS